MGIGKTCAHEVGHRIRLDPYNVIQYPETGVLHDRSYPENIVICTYYPDAPGIFEHAAAFRNPLCREGII